MNEVPNPGIDPDVIYLKKLIHPIRRAKSYSQRNLPPDCVAREKAASELENMRIDPAEEIRKAAEGSLLLPIIVAAENEMRLEQEKLLCESVG